MEDLSREPYQEVINDVAALFDRRFYESRERVQTPDTSFITYARDEFLKTPFYQIDPQSGRAVSTNLQPPSIWSQAKLMTKLAQETGVEVREGEDVAPKSILKIIQAVERQFKTRPGDITTCATGLFILTSFATAAKPLDYNAENPFKKSPRETDEQKVFRCALLAMNSYAQQKNLFTDEEKEVGLYGDRTAQIRADVSQSMADDPFIAATYGNYTNKSSLAQFSQKLLQKILSPEVTRRTGMDDIFLLDALHSGKPDPRMHLSPPSIDPMPVLETEWVMLPDATSEKSGSSDESRSWPTYEENTSTDEAVKMDPERIRWLGELLLSWTGARGFVSKLKARSTKPTRRYYGVMLPETLPNGQVIEHFVADNLSDEHGGFVYRGELGIHPETGEVFRTWREVFDKTRTHAAALGAKRFNHTPTIHDRMIDYLTKPAADLHK